MTSIINGKIHYNELSANSNGGTELMVRRMVEVIPHKELMGFQIVHSRIRDLHPNLKKIYVAHDLPNDPEMTRLISEGLLDQFEKVVFVSHYQQQMTNAYLGIPYSKGVVIENAITHYYDTTKLALSDTNGKVKLIYHTTPHRGLEILADVMEELGKDINPEVFHLDVFSSFNAYGWGSRDRDYKDVFQKLERLPNVTNHGFVPNETVREYVKNAHIFAYPSIWPETSCISLIEAMSAGCVCVHSSLAALPETAMGLTDMYEFTEDKVEHKRRFKEALSNKIRDIVTFGVSQLNERDKERLSDQYGLHTYHKKWTTLLKELK